MNKYNVDSERDLALLINFYELTIANGYFSKGLKDNRIVFEMFYRNNPDHGGYMISAGL